MLEDQITQTFETEKVNSSIAEASTRATDICAKDTLISAVKHVPIADLAKYECPESDDEYRHRMTVNAAAAAFTSVLILAGVWLANMMAHV